jgi:hypothetical protein
MRLVIEHVGAGPRGGELVSVTHYGEQNGDAMRDPAIVFEVVEGGWHPVSIQQDYVGSYQEAVFTGDDGKLYVRPALVRDIQAFARIWDRNLKHQGFVAAAAAGGWAQHLLGPDADPDEPVGELWERRRAGQ